MWDLADALDRACSIYYKELKKILFLLLQKKFVLFSYVVVVRHVMRILQLRSS